MFLQQPASLEWNLNCACCPRHMHQDWKTEHSEEEYVYTHIRAAHLQFGNSDLSHYHRWVLVAFCAEVALSLVLAVSIGLVEVHPLLCASSTSAHLLLFHFGKKAAICLIFMNHSWKFFNHSLHIAISMKLDSLLPLFSDFGVMLIDQVLCFLYCGAQTPSFAYFAHIQGKDQVRLV